MNPQKITEQPAAYGLPKRFTAVLFSVYLLVMCWILLFKLGVQFSYMGMRSVNLVPFQEQSIVTGENLLNVIIFLPLGIYGGVLFDNRSFGRKLLLFFLVSLFIEGFQFAFAIGAFDITDIITNTLGGVVGLGIFKAIEKVFVDRRKAQKFINVMATAGTIIMIVLLLLLKLDMLPIKYQ